MGDTVQRNEERTLPELEDLENLGLFTQEEFKKIVNLRRKFEYKIKRHSPLKHDHLAYIKHEKFLNRLRSLRFRKKRYSSKKKKTSVSDYAGVRKIMDIYRMGTTRWKGDLGMWLEYLEFCRENKHVRRANKIQGDIIRFHPKDPSVWTNAAAWEFNKLSNVKAARSLMQRGLSCCPTSEDLWVEYLYMELTYLKKLKARKVALGEDHGPLVSNYQETFEKQWRNENKQLFIPLCDKRENGDEPKNGVHSFRKVGLSIFRTVYNAAIKAIFSSFSLRTRLFEILEATDLDLSDEMRREILSDMKRDFSKDPQYWNWLASKEIKNSKVLDCTDCDTGPMPRVLAVYERAESEGCVTEDLACNQVTLYLQVGRLEKARELAEKLCTGKLSNAVDLWVLRISIEMRCIMETSASPAKADLTPIFGLLNKVLSDMTVSKAECLWRMALNIFSKRKKYADKLMDLAIACLIRDGGSDTGFSLSSAIIKHVLQTAGIHGARDKYCQFLGWKRPGVGLPRPGLVFYKKCTEMETNLALAGDKDGLENARKLYKHALATYEQDVDLWRRYYTMEIKTGSSKNADGVYMRAKMLLKDKVMHLSSADLG